MERSSQAWFRQLCEWRGEAGIPERLQVWTKFAKGVPGTNRVQQLLEVVAADILLHLGNGHDVLSQSFDKKKEYLQDVYCDTSQNPAFKAVSNSNGVAPCLCTSSTMYSFGRDRMLLPFEHLLMQGHTRSLRIPKNMSPSQIRSLAGEGICLPCLGTIVWALYLTKGLP